jgi:hypothetical protein
VRCFEYENLHVSMLLTIGILCTGGSSAGPRGCHARPGRGLLLPRGLARYGGRSRPARPG